MELPCSLSLMSLNKELATVVWIYEESLFPKLFYLTQCTAYAVVTVCKVVKLNLSLGEVILQI